MRNELARIPRPLQPPGTADPETIRRLASLGYLTAGSPPGEGQDLPDPKHAIAVLETFRRASLLLGQHRQDEAIALLRGLVHDHPQMREGWEELARVLRSAGRPSEAVEALLAATRLSPASPSTLLGIADAALEAGDLDRARAFAEGAAREGGRDAFEELASIALAAGDLAGARREIARALEANPDSRSARLIAARIEAKAGDLPAALARVEQAEEIGRRRGAPPLQGLAAARGDVLARNGDVEGARAAFRKEIDSFPENFDAWSKLAFLAAGAGDRDGYRRTLAEMTTRTPSRRSLLVAAEIARAVGDPAEAARWRRAAAAQASGLPAR
jgi:Tfp pilus assembly protein PilF